MSRKRMLLKVLVILLIVEPVLVQVQADSVDTLADILSNSNENTSLRIAAAEALGQINDSRVVDPLSDILSNGNEDTGLRIAAAKALGQTNHLGQINDSRRSLEICAYCGGNGREGYGKCPVCRGQGYILVKEPFRKCAYCGGSGRDGYGICPACGGTGRVNGVIK